MEVSGFGGVIVLYLVRTTVNHEYFIVKIFLDSLACAKI